MNPDALYSELRKTAADESRDWPAEAARLRDALQRDRSASKLAYLLHRVDELAAGRRDLHILDYGCGGGQLVIYLRLLGYEQVLGVDVSPENEAVNRQLAQRLGLSAETFTTYDTRTLPYADASFDLLLSETVLEHVHNLDDYYREASRVLRPGGRALLFFPHRLVPFDTHSRTWFLHYLPRPLQGPLYDRLTTQGGAYYAQILNLRTLATHRRIALRHFSSYALCTESRLRQAGYTEHYKGNRRLRAAVQKLIDAPLLGGLACRALSCLSEAEIVLAK